AHVAVEVVLHDHGELVAPRPQGHRLLIDRSPVHISLEFIFRDIQNHAVFKRVDDPPAQAAELSENVEDGVHHAALVLEFQVAVRHLNRYRRQDGLFGDTEEIRSDVKRQELGRKTGRDDGLQVVELDAGGFEDLGIKVQASEL